MIKVLKENEIKNLNYEDILNNIIDTVKSSDIEITNDKITKSDELIELNADIRQINCDWTYKLYCYYKFNDNNIDYDISLNLISSKEEMKPSDAVELSNLLQSIEEIMNV